MRRPDFSIVNDISGTEIVWEHLGMLSNPHYARAWQRKRAWYLEQGVVPYEKDPNAPVVLVTTEDSASGGISSHELDQLIDALI